MNDIIKTIENYRSNKVQTKLLQQIKNQLDSFMVSYENSEDDEKIFLIQEFEKERLNLHLVS